MRDASRHGGSQRLLIGSCVSVCPPDDTESTCGDYGGIPVEIDGFEDV